MNKGAKLNFNSVFKEISNSPEIVTVKVNACTDLHFDNIKGKGTPKQNLMCFFCALFHNYQISAWNDDSTLNKLSEQLKNRIKY